jgi:hypothetical protein
MCKKFHRRRESVEFRFFKAAFFSGHNRTFLKFYFALRDGIFSTAARLPSRLYQRLGAIAIEAFPGGKGGGASSDSNFAELLLGALRVPNVAHGFLVRPALLPRFAQAARGRFARLDPPLREFRFHGLLDLRHCQFHARLDL